MFVSNTLLWISPCTGVLGWIVTGFWFELLSYLGYSASLATIFHTDQFSSVSKAWTSCVTSKSSWSKGDTEGGYC